MSDVCMAMGEGRLACVPPLPLPGNFQAHILGETECQSRF
jgi:hypothetical protein